jgi:predicted MPP superfamily phosphohydrolase
MVLFFVLAAVVFGGMHYYLWFRLVKSADLAPPWDRRATAFLVGFAVLTPIAMPIGRLTHHPLAKALLGVVYTWMGIAILLLFCLLASEVARAVASLAMQPVDLERRTFVSRVIAGTVSVLAVGLAGLGVASALGKVALARVRVPLRRLPSPMSGFRIIQVSDLHIGATLGGDWLKRIVEEVNAADPDVVVITGDLVDGSVAQLRGEVAPLANLRARHGVFFVTGNHEYYSGVDDWLAELRRLGIRPLCNERVSIGDGDHSFDLAGVHDWSGRRFGQAHQPDLARALEGRDPSRELVLLAHQPKQIHEAEKLGVGLQLSGHTHGGQIFPWGLVVRLDQPYVAGLSQHGSAHIYVSRGTGFWGPPMRVAAPPEISVLELVAA